MAEHIGTGANEVRKKDRATRVLLKACSVGNIEILQLALAWGTEIEAVERRETTEPRAKEFGRNPIVHKSKDQTALLIATEWGWNDVTQIFLSHGAMSTARDASGLDALQTAVSSARVFEERLSLIATRGLAPSIFKRAGFYLAEGFESSDQVYLDHLSRMSGLEKDSSANVFKDLIMNFRVAMYSDPAGRPH